MFSCFQPISMKGDNKETKKMTDSEKIEEIFKRMKSFDELETTLATILKTINEQATKIQELQLELVKKDEEIVDLKGTLNDVSADVDELKQRSRMKNIIINGIDQEKKEDVYKIVEDIGKQLDINNPMDDVQVAHRMGPSKTASIVVRLLNSKTRTKWVKAGKEKQLWKKKIYVNEHLTPKNQELYKKTKEIAKTKNFKFVWVNDNRILVRKDEKSKVLIMKTQDDLRRMTNNP